MSPEEIKSALKQRKVTVRELASAASMEENYLTKSLNGGRRFKVEEMDAIRAYFRRLDAAADGEPVRMIPLLGEVPASRFQWKEQMTGRSVPVDPDTPPRAYALTVRHDSMDLVAEEGTRLIVDPDDIELWPGRRYIIRTPDGTTFKEYQSDPARLVPCSSNDAHGEIMLGSEPIEVLGRVIFYVTRDMARRH
jgi:repressor LexA